MHPQNDCSSCVNIPGSTCTCPCAQASDCVTLPAACPHSEETVSPNPVFPATAAQLVLTPLEVAQSGNTVLVTVSIAAESFITLPKPALEIKRITKNLKLTQCRFFNAIPPILPGVPMDTPKLFLGGFVRKDIQYAAVTNQKSKTIISEIEDLEADIPISGVVDLGAQLTVPEQQSDQQQQYEYSETLPLPSDFPEKEKLLTGDFSENNVINNKFLNQQPVCELIYSKIDEMDEVVDRVPLPGSAGEGVFRTLQEKMVLLVQISLTFSTEIDP